MRHELRAIPPAPRLVRWRPLFAHRWLLLAAGLPLVAIGALVAWLMFLQSGGKMSLGPRLDAGPVVRVPGVLRAVWPPRAFPDGSQRQEVRYEFRIESSNLRGGCFVPVGEWREGGACEVEALAADWNVNRIRGGALHLDRDWLRARFWVTALAVPGGLLLLAWLAGALQLRQVLVHGDASLGVVHRVQRVQGVLPEMLRVDYTFRDHRATTRHNRHWVRAHGELGVRLLAQMAAGRFEEMPVLHDRRFPQWNRMLLPADFLRPPGPLDLGFDLDLGEGKRP
jgi:hypothetical protein